jgi:hypothetical protein
MDIEDIVDPEGPPPWLHLLTPMQKAWLENQILKGRNPDSYIEGQLKEAERWPENPKKAKDARRPQRRKPTR